MGLREYRVFSHDVTAAILVSQTNPLRVELFSNANAFFCSNKFAQMLATRLKTPYNIVSLVYCSHLPYIVSASWF